MRIRTYNTAIRKLDPHHFWKLDPNPHESDADPQHCRQGNVTELPFFYFGNPWGLVVKVLSRRTEFMLLEVLLGLIRTSN
jgi:hypothetical protein